MLNHLVGGSRMMAACELKPVIAEDLGVVSTGG